MQMKPLYHKVYMYAVAIVATVADVAVIAIIAVIAVIAYVVLYVFSFTTATMFMD